MCLTFERENNIGTVQAYVILPANIMPLVQGNNGRKDKDNMSRYLWWECEFHVHCHEVFLQTLTTQNTSTDDELVIFYWNYNFKFENSKGNTYNFCVIFAFIEPSICYR
jgi:hypothetical protein